MRFWKKQKIQSYSNGSRRGVATIDYAMLLCVICGVIISTVEGLSQRMNRSFDRVAYELVQESGQVGEGGPSMTESAVGENTVDSLMQPLGQNGEGSPQSGQLAPWVE